MTKKNIGLTYEQLEDNVKKYLKRHDLPMIRKAYQYAAEKHFGVKRLTGEDYIEHPLNVAYILSEMKSDRYTLCAALLHDVI